MVFQSWDIQMTSHPTPRVTNPLLWHTVVMAAQSPGSSPIETGYNHHSITGQAAPKAKIREHDLPFQHAPCTQESPACIQLRSIEHEAIPTEDKFCTKPSHCICWQCIAVCSAPRGAGAQHQAGTGTHSSCQTLSRAFMLWS